MTDADQDVHILQAMTRNEPRGFDVIFVKQFQQSRNALSAREITCSEKKSICDQQLGVQGVSPQDSNIPREISLVESSPLYEPNHPAIASISTPYETRTRFLGLDVSVDMTSIDLVQCSLKAMCLFTPAGNDCHQKQNAVVLNERMSTIFLKNRKFSQHDMHQTLLKRFGRFLHDVYGSTNHLSSSCPIRHREGRLILLTTVKDCIAVKLTQTFTSR